MRIVIAGGVAAGMSAAARARRLDERAEIIVFEKGKHVSYANCGLPYYVGGEIEDVESLLVQTPTSLRNALNIDVRLEHEVIGLDPEAKTVTVRSKDGEHVFGYDALVLAPGGEAIEPDFPGVDSDRVWHLRTVPDAVELKERVEAGAKRAVVLGAGYIGLEAAEAFALQGLEVTIVELASHIMPPLEAEVAALVTTEVNRIGINTKTGVKAVEIKKGDDHDVVVLSDGTEIDADLIVLSVGVRPATAAFEAAGIACHNGAIIIDNHGRTNTMDVWAGGDATASPDLATGELRPVALAGPANRAGRLIADNILWPKLWPTHARPIVQPLATAIVRIGEMTAAVTGSNRAALDAAGVDYHTVNLHPNQHAGYFPGAQQIHMVVHFAKSDGRILGAHAAGPDGVDKRIDVFATAIRGKMTVDDLIDLDLAYSPPYGSAKDPVNLVGMFGQNVMQGLTRLWYAEEIAEVMETSLVLDARTAAEFESGHLPGALNVPHIEVRERLEEIRAAANGRPIRVHCASGFRSYFAERILRQEGFDVANLSGGMLSLKAAMMGGLAPVIALEVGQSSDDK